MNISKSFVAYCGNSGLIKIAAVIEMLIPKVSLYSSTGPKGLIHFVSHRELIAKTAAKSGPSIKSSSMLSVATLSSATASL